MTHRAVTALLLALLCVAPWLVFPELLPAGIRTVASNALAALSICTAGVLLRGQRQSSLGLWLFLGAVLLSGILNSPKDPVALRHFSGLAFGLLSMAVVARTCTTTLALRIAASITALLATIVFLVGLSGTSLARKDAAGIPLSEKFGAVTRMIPPAVFSWLPEKQLRLPGLDRDGGFVNSNALGGTAVMLLPICLGLLSIRRHTPRDRLTGPFGWIAATAVAAGTVALAFSLSRTAWVAALLTVITASVSVNANRGTWTRLRHPLVIGGLIVMLMAGAIWSLQKRTLPTGSELSRSVSVRASVWAQALAALQERPLLGLGINRFHDIDIPATPATDAVTRVAHAHNVWLQVALDVGLVGLAGYVALFGALVANSIRLRLHHDRQKAALAWGAGLSLVAVHWFGLTDAIALGSKVGLFQWLCAGFILAADPQDTRLPSR